MVEPVVTQMYQLPPFLSAHMQLVALKYLTVAMAVADVLKSNVLDQTHQTPRVIAQAQLLKSSFPAWINARNAPPRILI